jgi:hypothetical protein
LSYLQVIFIDILICNKEVLWKGIMAT